MDVATKRVLAAILGLLLIFVIAYCAGCALPQRQRPNKPGKSDLTFKSMTVEEYIALRDKLLTPVRKTTTVEASADMTNDENPEAPMAGSVGPDGANVNTGGSAPFKWEAVTGEPLFWWSGFFMLLGIGLLVLANYPALGKFIPAGAGWYAIGAGIVIGLLPWIGEGLKPVVKYVVAATVTVAFFFIIYYGWKNKWFEWATGPDNQRERMNKGDVDGAAALAYVHGKGDKNTARLMKNGHNKPPTNGGTGNG